MNPTATIVTVLTVLAMNAYANGTRLFFWTAAGDVKYNTVQSTSRLADVGTLCQFRSDNAFEGDPDNRYRH
ncbi:hypothetical protein PISMIDRAFT_687001 [Pisolithus microcarpus 441]|uniref:Unplaced genomic scaffold scaffold_195, whole genome shotgun sequence n=1 Tax=Pisolithus microcarpus 441 TaxID=765257 RepID=A0A0C9Z762_9AGAM|nr:hypothetical protein PISMIDRAFT_687001 [Pisolithus microcarpus 441]